ncbi:MAG: prepilin-type N-terminal cleavage/methylation domain-containing protein [Rehaibacterium terrae]|uniref:prepilin-type N-terminal cleavage/methylation domain-containing protein n=1 Tax=Rehaibacterium terrae TaxID=1341696 RepID=UPI00391A3AC2
MRWMQRGRLRGFTLLELLVVLALLAMTVALVGPALQRTYDGLVRSSARDEVQRALETLPLRVRESGARLALEPGTGDAWGALLPLPAGWTVQPLTAVEIEASGVCHPARLRVRGPDDSYVVELTRPYCRLADAR